MTKDHTDVHPKKKIKQNPTDGVSEDPLEVVPGCNVEKQPPLCPTTDADYESSPLEAGPASTVEKQNPPSPTDADADSKIPPTDKDFEAPHEAVPESEAERQTDSESSPLEAGPASTVEKQNPLSPTDADADSKIPPTDKDFEAPLEAGPASEAERQTDSESSPPDPDSEDYPDYPYAYTRQGYLGRGDHGIVGLYTVNSRPDELVAIKAFEDMSDKFPSDSDLMPHRNILPRLCCLDNITEIWVIMPYVRLGSLQSIIISNYPDGIPEKFLGKILKELLLAMSHIHGNGNVHGNIKASNIFLDDDGSVMLGDIGLNSMGCNRSEQSRVYWIPPELGFESMDSYSDKSDIWCFGICALEMAKGRPPISEFPQPHLQSLMMHLIHQRFPTSVEKLKMKANTIISGELQTIIKACLIKDPSKRPTAGTLLQDDYFSKVEEESLADFVEGLKPLLKRPVAARPDAAACKVSRLLWLTDDSYDTDEQGILGWNFNESSLEFDPVVGALKRKIQRREKKSKKKNSAPKRKKKE